MSSISDPSRLRRRDRRRAKALIDTALSEGRLTAAEHALRTQRVTAAQTVGDLAMVTRDLVAPTDLRLGSALDAAALSSMRVGGGYRGTGLRAGLPSGATLDLSAVGKRIRLIILIAIASVVGVCFLGLAAVIVPSVVRSSHGTSSSTPAATSAPTPDVAFSTDEPPGAVASNLHSAAGWTALVDAIKEKSGSTSVYDVVAYPDYAAVGLDGDGEVERGLYRAGGWQDGFDVRTPAVGSLVDLRQIDPKVIARLPVETAEHFGIDDPSGTYLIVNAIPNDPKIMVYVQSSAGSQYRVYGLDGTPRG